MRLASTVQECGRRQQGLATARGLQAAGVSRSGLSRAVAGGHVFRVRPSVYSCEPLPPLPLFLVTDEGAHRDDVLRVRAALLSLGPTAVAGGRTAACLRGWGLLAEPRDTIEVSVRSDRGRVRMAGVRAVRRRLFTVDHVSPVPGQAPLPVTGAAATVLDCCAILPLLEAVVVCDSALRSGQVTLAELAGAARRMRGVRAATQVRRVLELCDPESGSVLESVLRVEMLHAGLTGFSSQRVITDARGRYVRRVDFCFEDARLVVETDGARWHDVPARDRSVDNRLAAAGWRVLRLTWSQVVHDPPAVLALIEAALACGTPDTRFGPTTAPEAA